MKKNVIIFSTIGIILLILIGICCFIFFDENHKVAVLCYHNLATEEEIANFPDEKDWVIDVNNFEEQLKYLKDHNYKTLTIDEFYKWKKGEIDIPYKSVLITFDDGFLSNYHYAFPLLKKYNMNATVFLVGEFIDSAEQEEWDGNIKTYMTKNLLEKSKIEYPNIDFCSHSYGLHYENSIKENSIISMKDDTVIFDNNMTETKVFSYPFGEYNHNIIEALKQKGYIMAFRYGPTKDDYRKASRDDDDFKIPRLNISHGMEIWKFGLRLLLPN